jgi:hypothetical protein
VDALGSVLQSFAMQNSVDAWCGRRFATIVLGPSPTKCFSIRSSTEEAGAMSSGECRRFVEKEQFRPALPGHHNTTNSFVVAAASNLGFGRPASLQQGLRGRIMYDPAITNKETTLAYRNDFTERRDAVLQWP